MSASEDDDHALYAMQLASASVLPMVLKATIELGVLEIIERAGPGAALSPAEIASHLPTHNNPDASLMLERILRLLASYSILTCSLDNHDDGQVHRLYGLAPVAKYFIPNQDGVSLASVYHSIQDKWILHSWDDNHCLKILQNCYEALPDDGKVIIVDLVVPAAVDNGPGVRGKFQFDLFLMNMNPGGKERTEQEFTNLAKEAGFSSIRVVCCAYNFSLVEFYKKV